MRDLWLLMGYVSTTNGTHWNPGGGGPTTGSLIIQHLSSHALVLSVIAHGGCAHWIF